MTNNIKKITDNELIEKIMPDLEIHEGIVPFGYKDTKGNITIGKGIHIETLNEFKSLPLYNPDGSFASDAQKETEFNFIKNSTDGNVKGTLKLSDAVIDKYTKEHIQNDLKLLRNKFNNEGIDFDKLPIQAKEVIIDMQYNMGENNFTSQKWPNFFNAIKNEDWEKAAEESTSYDIQRDRNEWRKNTLKSIE